MEETEEIKKLLGGVSPQIFKGGSANYISYCGVCDKKIIGYSDESIKEAQRHCLEKLIKHVEEEHVGGKRWMEEFEKLVGPLEEKKPKNIFEQIRKEKE